MSLSRGSLQDNKNVEAAPGESRARLPISTPRRKDFRMTTLTVNGKATNVTAPDDTPCSGSCATMSA